MSLVSYDYSSDENSDQEDVQETQVSETSLANGNTKRLIAEAATTPTNSTPRIETGSQSSKNDPIEDEDEPISTTHLPLPAPKKVTNDLNVEEEDDEFLRKKAVPELKPAPPPTSLASIRPNVKNGKVQITVPSLRDFRDNADDVKPKPKPIIGAELPSRATGLLGMLPKPKSELAFSSSSSTHNSQPVPQPKPIVNRLIPDSVANRSRNVQPDPKLPKKPPVKKSETTVKSTGNDSEDSDDGGEVDFFSLNLEEKLPEISTNEINAMVAKRAAKMAEAVKKFDEPEAPEEIPGTSGLQQFPQPSEESNDLTNERALSALIGGNKAKRARLDDVNIIEISSSDIVPSKEDFMRRQLQDETGYVPTGHLTGDWTCTSKRKSHITYLATKAQANAQELEAMWSSNRQSRRQTQSKYGF